MQSATHRTWISVPSLKLALAALGVAAILFGIAAYVMFQGEGDSAVGSISETAARQTFLEANPRFLDTNVLPQASTTGDADRQAVQRLQHYHFLDMNVLPGDDVASDAPIQTGQPH